jgi:predicted lipoprotein with Yx(FWY)xxD motif
VRFTTYLRVAALAAMCLGATASSSFARGDEGPQLATPPGITVQLVGKITFNLIIGYNLDRVQQFAYADAKGMTLYTYGPDEDAPGKSTCVAACAAEWPPALALPGAKAFGNWSLIKRDDGAKQWAFRGKPLYSYSKDLKVSDINGRGLDQGNWQAALFDPNAGIVYPPGISADEIADANGQVLVNAKGHAIYAFDGNVKREDPACSGSPCVSHWHPLAAPELASAVGDFSVVIRNDETRQWAYKGKPLFTYDGDYETGYAAAIGLDKKLKPAVVTSYFMPPEISTHPTLGQGYVLSTKAGMTVYRRDAYVYQLGGHGLRRGVPPRPHVGRDIGTSMHGCDAKCQTMWLPVKANAKAQPSGFYQIITREDGTRQWTYKGYALYTYAGDKKPGDMLGNDLYDFAFSRDPNKAAERPSRMTAAGALLWMYAFP